MQINLRPSLVLPKPLTAALGRTIEFVGSDELPKGAGAHTDSYGNIKILKRLPMREQMKAGWHEEVHSWLSPKGALLRQYRAQLHDSAYQRMVFCRYLEEAAAEAYSLIREKKTFGSEASYGEQIIAGMKFPLSLDGYAILARARITQEPLVAVDIETQGYMFGSIIVEGHLFNAYVAHRSPANAQRK